MKPFSKISGGIAEQDHVLVAPPLMMREPQKWNMFGAGKPVFPLGPDLGGVGTGKGGGDINPGERRGQKMDGISSWHGHNPEHRSLFLVNTGHVTCYSPEGVMLWQTLTKVRWGMDRRKAGESSLETLSVQPSLTALPLHLDQLPKHVVAVAAGSLAVLNAETGSILHELDLVRGPVSGVTVGDFTNDRVNDVIIITAKGYTGYRVRVRAGAGATTVLMVVLLFLLALVLVFKLLQEDDEDELSDEVIQSEPAVDKPDAPPSNWIPGDRGLDAPAKFPRRTFFGQRSRQLHQQLKAAKQL
jgi:hypothetical protein